MHGRLQEATVAHGGSYPAIREGKAGGMTGAHPFAIDCDSPRVDIRAGFQIVHPALQDMLQPERATNG